MESKILIPESNTVYCRVPQNNQYFFVSDFNSLEDFYDYVDKFEHQFCDDRASHDGDFDFTGTNNFEEARKLARVSGDLESLKRINYDDDLELRRFAKGLSLEGLDTELQCSGSYVDIDAFLQGQPECMAEFTESHIPKFCDIIVNVSQSCGISKETIQERGVILFRLIDALEKAKIRTRIQIAWVVSKSFCTEDTDMSLLRITCKDYGQLLNKEQLSFALCHASFLRRFCFCHSEIINGFARMRKHEIGLPYKELISVINVPGTYGKPNRVKNIPEEIWRPQSNSYIFLLDDVNVNDLKKLEGDVKNLINKENKKW